MFTVPETIYWNQSSVTILGSFAKVKVMRCTCNILVDRTGFDMMMTMTIDLQKTLRLGFDYGLGFGIAYILENISSCQQNLNWMHFATSVRESCIYLFVLAGDGLWFLFCNAIYELRGSCKRAQHCI